MSLAHKGLEVDCVPWRFTEKEKIAFSGQERVPVLVDGDKTVSDSWNIAKYLETQYPDSPSLKLENGEVLFLKFWTETVLHPGLIKLLLLDVHNSLTEKDKIYFRESREKLFGKTLEEVVNGREERLPNLQKLLTPLSLTLKQQEFLAGESPGFSDYIVFGAFQWARCISDFSLLQADDSIYEWREKMLGLHDGLAGNAVGYSV
jgi:glutathione S-transferase